MSIRDDTMWDYYRLLLELPEAKIEKLKAGHPMQAKKHLASSLVGQFHSMKAAKHELGQFEQVFSKNKLPDDMPSFTWSDLVGDAATAPLFEVMAQSELFESKGAVRRLVRQGAVKIDGEKQSDPNLELAPAEGERTFQAGKRIFFKLAG
jgi:tyrosyl-tRNA synthetase